MAKNENSKSKSKDPIVRELAAIKMLLITLLYKLGAKGQEIAEALKMDNSDVSKLLSARKIKSIINDSK